MKKLYIMLVTRDGIYHKERYEHRIPPAEYHRPLYPTVPVGELNAEPRYASMGCRRYSFAGYINEAGVEMPLYQEVAE